VLLQLDETGRVVKEIGRESEESLPISCNVRYIPPVWTDRQTDRETDRQGCEVGGLSVI